MGSTVHDLEFHEPVRQQAQTPLRVTLWWRAARQGDQVRLLLPIELGSPTGAALPTAGKRRLDALFKAAPPGALDRGTRDLERLGDALVAAAFVGQPQRARAAGREPRGCLW